MKLGISHVLDVMREVIRMCLLRTLDTIQHHTQGVEPKAAISRLLPLFYPQKQARWTTIAHIIKLRLDKSTIDQGLNTLASNYLQLA